jgi:hypothetical protein
MPYLSFSQVPPFLDLFYFSTSKIKLNEIFLGSLYLVPREPTPKIIQSLFYNMQFIFAVRMYIQHENDLKEKQIVRTIEDSCVRECNFSAERAAHRQYGQAS